jgi:3-hydroxyisobutyrate dehydrogenase and related beta-hydroxyacid dehydrogenases
MAKIAFLGLGMMGSRMAARLLEAGHELTVWNRASARAAPLARLGATAASSPAAAVAGAELVITMLATPEAVEQVAFADEGLAEGLCSGQVLIDMSTVGPDAARSVAARLPQGVPLVDAPVRGSIAEATAGRLHVFVGASDADFARVRPVLAVFGDVRHTGGPGSGQAMKLVVNLALGASMVVLGEALALGGALALPQEMVLDVLSDSPIGPAVSAKRSDIESGDYEPAFALRLAEKDLKLVTDAAAGDGRDLKVARATLEWLEEASRRGAGDLDFSAVVATIAGEHSQA